MLHIYNVSYAIEIMSDFMVKIIIGSITLTSIVQQTVLTVVAGATSAQTFPGAWMTVLTVPGTRLFTKLAIKSKTFAPFLSKKIITVFNPFGDFIKLYVELRLLLSLEKMHNNTVDANNLLIF